ncbi:MAG: hypothetical protein ACJAWP_000397 [Porticoccus sp.]
MHDVRLGAKATAYWALEQLHAIYTDRYAFRQQDYDNFDKRAVVQKRVDEIGKMAKPTGVPFISVMAKAFTPCEGLDTAGEKAQVGHDLHGLVRPPRPFQAGHGQRHPECAVATPRCRWWCATDLRRTLQPFLVVTTYKLR